METVTRHVKNLHDVLNEGSYANRIAITKPSGAVIIERDIVPKGDKGVFPTSYKGNDNDKTSKLVNKVSGETQVYTLTAYNDNSGLSTTATCSVKVVPATAVPNPVTPLTK